MITASAPSTFSGSRMIGMLGRPISPLNTNRRRRPDSSMSSRTLAAPRMWPARQKLASTPRIGENVRWTGTVMNRSSVATASARVYSGSNGRLPSRRRRLLTYFTSLSWMCAESWSMYAQRSRVADVA